MWEGRIHTFSTSSLVLVATRRRSYANLARIATVTLSNDTEAACNSGVKTGNQRVLPHTRRNEDQYSQTFPLGQHPPPVRHVTWNGVH